MSLDLTFEETPPETTGKVLFEQTVPSDLSRKSDVIEELLSLFEQNDLLQDQSERVRARMCLDELLVNAIKHGNNEDPEKTVFLQFFVNRDQTYWGLRIEDEGDGFSPDEIPDPRKPDHREMESGRGLLLVKNFVDNLVFYDQGSGVLMTRAYD